MERTYDMLIIGGGPGGYTAALYAARAGLRVLVLEKLFAGGQMTQTHLIDNYPGFPEGVDGITLAMNMQQQAQRFGAETVNAEVTRVELRAEPKAVHTSEGVFYGKTVVIATGADPRPLGVAREEELRGRGIHYCAACDGNFYRGKTVAVVGGGNTAAGDALLLSRVAQKVILIHRRDTLRATKIYHQALLDAPNVEICWNAQVSALLGADALTGVKLKDVRSGEEREVRCDAVFVSIGRDPATAFLDGALAQDKGGYILADDTTRTDIPGVFAVGDVRTKELRQIITAAADGAVAVHHAEHYLAESRLSE